MTDEAAAPYLRLLEETTAKLKRSREQNEQLKRAAREPIAIVGLACRFPGGVDSPESLWRLLTEGRDAVGHPPPQRWRPEVAARLARHHGGFLDDVERFDADFFGISPREALVLDPQHRLALEVTWEAFEVAGIAPASLSGTRTGVFFGLTANDYRDRVTAAGISAAGIYGVTGNLNAALSGRISYLLGLQGPSLVLDTACSSSLVAVHLA